MHRPARCSETTSSDVTDTGQDEWCPPICSSPTGAIVWIRERFIEPSTRCLGRSACEAHPTVGALVCTTCAIDLRQTPSCNGIGPVRIPKGDCLYCLPTLVMYTSPIRSGIWRALPISCARRCNGCRNGGRIGHEHSRVECVKFSKKRNLRRMDGSG